MQLQLLQAWQACKCSPQGWPAACSGIPQDQAGEACAALYCTQQVHPVIWCQSLGTDCQGAEVRELRKQVDAVLAEPVAGMPREQVQSCGPWEGFQQRSVECQRRQLERCMLKGCLPVAAHCSGLQHILSGEVLGDQCKQVFRQACPASHCSLPRLRRMHGKVLVHIGLAVLPPDQLVSRRSANGPHPTKPWCGVANGKASDLGSLVNLQNGADLGGKPAELWGC